MGDGRGYWRYVPTATGTTFITGYDYEPGFGRPGALIDRLLTRSATSYGPDDRARNLDRGRLAPPPPTPTSQGRPSASATWCRK